MEQSDNTYTRWLQRQAITNRKDKSCEQINKLMDCKVVSIPRFMVSKELDIYKFRFDTGYPIFKIHHFSYDTHQQDHSLNTDLVLAKIVYELPDQLISQLQHPVSIQNCLYILKAVLMGCEKLVDCFGWFKLNEWMIGLGGISGNQCKVWVNQRFDINKVQNQAETEQEMVESIKKIIIRLLGNKQVNNSFSKQLMSRQYKIIDLINTFWQFSYENSILIPPFFQVKQHKKTKSQFSDNDNKYHQNCNSIEGLMCQKNIYNHRTAGIQSTNYSLWRRRHQNTQTNQICDRSSFKILNGKKNYKNLSEIDETTTVHRKNSKLEFQLNNQTNKVNNIQQRKMGNNDGFYATGNTSAQGSDTVKMNESNNCLDLFTTFGLPQGIKTMNNRRSDLMNSNYHKNQKSIVDRQKSASKQELSNKTKTPTKMTVTPHKIHFMTRTQQNYINQQNKNPPSPSISNLKNFDHLFETSPYVSPSHQQISSIQPPLNPYIRVQPSQQVIKNKNKMKELIKQKIKQNRQKKKVKKLQSINTVKSIGDFTQSERKIGNDNLQLDNVKILHKMCTKIGISQVHIEGEDFSQDQDYE